MKRVLGLVLIVAATGCAGVHAGTSPVTTPCWSGDVVEADAVTSASWLKFSLFPSLSGGAGFNLNGDGVDANVLFLNAGADFTSK